MSLFSVGCIAVGFVAFGLFVALRLCSSDKSPPEARDRLQEPNPSHKAGAGHRA
ncbi:hypothetical protein [Salinicola lusitanus]|jgi:hypothetical protein|uniref:Uncharacterized protein n=1 Tax=Salinicola lusitanus TaxID=1949085 RepID=A0ABZ3CZ09_9GAMM|nr:hypothetical protein [Salinicola lusitanus]